MDAREGVGAMAPLEPMEESCRASLPVKPKEVLARHGLDELFNSGKP